MVKAITVSFSKFKVKIGDGADPEVFSAPCGFTSRAFNRSKSLNETNVPDCDDEDAPSWTERDVVALTWSVSGQGVMAAQSVALWDAAYESTESISVMVEIDYPAPVGTVSYKGKAHVESIEDNGEKGQRVLRNISMQSDGPLVRTPAL